MSYVNKDGSPLFRAAGRILAKHLRNYGITDENVSYESLHIVLDRVKLHSGSLKAADMPKVCEYLEETFSITLPKEYWPKVRDELTRLDDNGVDTLTKDS